MGGTVSRRIYCPADPWTTVKYGGVLWHKKWTIDVDGYQVKWRRYGWGVPPYWEGTATGVKTVAAYP